MRVVTFDAETYYDREYSLSKITTEEYVRSPLFEMIGFAIKIDDGPTEWVPQPMTEDFIKSFDWSDAMVLCQNTAFEYVKLAVLSKSCSCPMKSSPHCCKAWA